MKALFALFEGRSHREDWWFFAFFPPLALGAIARALRHVAPAEVREVVQLALAIGVLALSLPITVRRLHDTDRSGWYSLVSLIPVVGELWIIVDCGFQRGNETTNQYGRAVS